MGSGHILQPPEQLLKVCVSRYISKSFYSEGKPSEDWNWTLCPGGVRGGRQCREPALGTTSLQRTLRYAAQWVAYTTQSCGFGGPVLFGVPHAREKLGRSEFIMKRTRGQESVCSFTLCRHLCSLLRGGRRHLPRKFVSLVTEASTPTEQTWHGDTKQIAMTVNNPTMLFTQ